jgi:hypothetical protein
MTLRLQILKWFLRISALIQISLWGITHIFFPEWYLRVIAGKSPDLITDFNILIINEIGIMSLAFGIATWLSSKDPVRNLNIIIMLIIASVGSISVTLYQILIRQTSQEWGHVFIVLLQLIILIALYPWKEAIVREL